MKSLLFASWIALCAGCATQLGPGADGGNGDSATATSDAPNASSDAGSTIVDAATTNVCSPWSAPAACGTTSGSAPVSTPTESAFRAFVARRWLLCGTQSAFGNDVSEVGLELTADGHWYKLYAGNGGVARGEGFDQEGTWSVILTGDPAGQPFQLNLDINGSGTVITHPVLGSDPDTIVLNNEGVFVGRYVDGSATPLVSARCNSADAGADAGPGICGNWPQPPACARNPTGTADTTTESAFRQYISRRWLLCGTESVFGDNLGDVGLDVLPDGTWFKLYPAKEGGVVQGDGGTWSIIDVGGIPEQPFQLDLLQGDLTYSSHPAFASDPVAMRLNNEGVFIGNYVDGTGTPTGLRRCDQ